MCYPSDFLRGCFILTAEETGVYRTLIDMMYDRSGPVDDDPKELARIAGCTTRKFKMIRDKLLHLPGKLTRTDDGRLFNGRVALELKRRNGKGEQNGGQNSDFKSGKISEKPRDNRGDKTPSFGTQSGNSNGLTSDRPVSVARAREIPDSIKKVSNQPTTLESTLAKAERFCREVGLSLTSDPKHARFIDQLNKLEDQGVDFDLDMLPLIKERIARGSLPASVTPNYFATPALARATARKANAEKSASQAFQETNVDGWAGRLRSWISCGHWPLGKYGPRPTDPDCRAPADMVTKAVAAWNAQGRHPREWFCELGSCFKPWDRVVVFRDEADGDRGLPT
jgi:uncharacterized protein YdaU (DUF1376 family)